MTPLPSGLRDVEGVACEEQRASSWLREDVGAVEMRVYAWMRARV